MARTPLARWVGRTVRRLDAAADAESLVESAWKTEPAKRSTRQAFLRDAGALGFAVASAGSLGRLVPVAHAAAPRIVVVGAGLAGLTCAHRLRQAGYTAEVHEASDRVGGRCWTIRGVFDDGQLGERGGEFIDTAHREIRRLVRELDLEVDDVNAAEAPGTELTSYFEGERYTEAQATADIQGPWRTWRDDTRAAGYPTTYRSFTPRGFELDHMSVAEYLEATIPGGRRSKLGQLLDVAYNIEYGAETSEQSALNFLYLIGFARQTELKLFGESDERFHVRGGNDEIAARLAERLPGQITLGSELVAIEQRPNGTFRLSFHQGSGTATVVAEKVVLALPFSILRSSVDYSRAGFKPRKVLAIEEQGMGTNSKLHVQFVNRRWENLGYTGETYSDRGYQSSWDVTRAQPGRPGILVDYTGGTIGASFGDGSPAERAGQFLRQIEPVLPGTSERWNGKATVDFWLGYPWTRGSYSYWKVGQYTRFAGVEQEPHGNCHFAGEHTSIDAQGYLNGAVETGERAANEVVADLRVAQTA
jgi:monoamine oxidase